MTKVKLICLTYLCSSLVFFSSAQEQSCPRKASQCITAVNGAAFANGTYSPSKGVELLWGRNHSIVWYSEPVVKQLGFTCITSVFDHTGGTDTYLNGCQKIKEVEFAAGLIWDDKILNIIEYEGHTFQSINMYVIYYKKYCVGLYACNIPGRWSDEGNHVAVYCPTVKLGDSAVQAEVEEAKQKLSQCNINDGVATCQDQAQCP